MSAFTESGHSILGKSRKRQAANGQEPTSQKLIDDSTFTSGTQIFVDPGPTVLGRRMLRRSRHEVLQSLFRRRKYPLICTVSMSAQHVAAGPFGRYLDYSNRDRKVTFALGLCAFFAACSIASLILAVRDPLSCM